MRKEISFRVLWISWLNFLNELRAPMCFDFFILLNPAQQVNANTFTQLPLVVSVAFISSLLSRFLTASGDHTTSLQESTTSEQTLWAFARGNCVFHHIGADLTVSPREDHIPPHRGRTSDLTCFSKMCASAFTPLRSTWQTLKVVAVTFACAVASVGTIEHLWKAFTREKLLSSKRSLYNQPKPCTILREIPQIYHRFAACLMTPA